MNQWEEEDRRRQGEMFTLVHLRQRRGQAADQAGPEQTRSKLFGYQPDPVGCHLILREQKTRRAQALAGQKCTQELRVVTQELRVVTQELGVVTQELRVVRSVRRNCVWSAGG